MCENFSNAQSYRKNYRNPTSDAERYKEIIKDDLKSYLQYLNVGDIKNLSNRALKSIAVNLMSSLVDVCVWGNYLITNDGILELCMAHSGSKLRRINHCGCYKVSDDSRLWFMSSFKHTVINYIRVEEFGNDIDYNSQVEVADAAEDGVNAEATGAEVTDDSKAAAAHDAAYGK